MLYSYHLTIQRSTDFSKTKRKATIEAEEGAEAGRNAGASQIPEPSDNREGVEEEDI